MTNPNHTATHTKPLSFPSARTSPHRAGSFGSAEIVVSSSSMADLVRDLGAEVIGVLRKQSSPGGTLGDLSFDKLSRQVFDVVHGMPDLADLTPQLAAMGERERLLRLLVADQPHPLKTDVKGTAENVVAQPLNDVRGKLLEIFDASPFAIERALEETYSSIRDLQIPKLSKAAFDRFGRLVEAAKRLNTGRNVIASHKREPLTEVFLAHAVENYHETLHLIARQVTADALREGISRLKKDLKDLDRRAVSVLANVQSIEETWGKECKHVHEREVFRDGDHTISIPGPTAEVLRLRMRENLDSNGDAELVDRLLADWRNDLRLLAEQLGTGLQQDASLPTLIEQLPPELVAARFVEVVRLAVGHAGSIWPFLNSAGIERCSEELWHRAAPIVELAARDRSELEVEPVASAILCLPATIAPQDSAIREAFVLALRRFDPCIEVVRTDMPYAPLRLCRVIQGYPLSIEAANNLFSRSYLAASEADHPPHLLGPLGSKDGQPLDRVVSLIDQIRTSGR